MNRFTDLHLMTEDDRVEIIANTAVTKMHDGRYPEMAFIVDNSEIADRYIEKLKELQPSIRVLRRMPGPTAHAYSVIIQSDGGSVQ